MDWDASWKRAQALLEGVQRGRVATSDPGVELATLDWGGEGDLVMMHHANGFNAACFAPIAAALSDSYRVVAVDARGHGDSTPVDPRSDDAAYAWDRLAKDYGSAARRIMEERGYCSARLAIGHSFGGALTLSAESMDPGLFDAALLLDPVIFSRSMFAEEAVPKQENPLAAMTRKRRDRFPTRAEAFAHFAGRGLFKDFVPEALALYVGEGMVATKDGDLTMKCDREVEASIFDGGGTLDVFSIADQIKTKTRILHAQRGNFSFDLYEEFVAKMPSAEAESLDIGHLVAMEQPDCVVAEARAMLSKGGET